VRIPAAGIPRFAVLECNDGEENGTVLARQRLLACTLQPHQLPLPLSVAASSFPVPGFLTHHLHLNVRLTLFLTPRCEVQTRMTLGAWRMCLACTRLTTQHSGHSHVHLPRRPITPVPKHNSTWPFSQWLPSITQVIPSCCIRPSLVSGPFSGHRHFLSLDSHSI